MRSARRLMAAAVLIAGQGTAFAAAQPAAQYRLDISATDLSTALKKVAIDTGANLVAPADLVDGRTSPELHGTFSTETAIDALLKGSGLTFTRLNGAILIERAEGDAKSGAGKSRDKDGDTADILVTGTHIRGAPPTSPVIILTRKQIEQSAPGSVEELMRRVPQNLSAGVGQENFAVTGAGADITDHGAGINLRGLGQRATLVLVNGRRLAPSGSGSFVDVSLIPVSAIERVEILTDGASAIYGSDAVGGVVNFILRKDFQGLETMFQAGTTTDGGGRQLLAGLTGGGKWKSGRGLISYEYRDNRPIKAGSRDFTINLPASWDLFPAEKRHSLYGTANQQLTNNLQLDLSATYAARDTQRSFIDGGLPVNASATSRSFGGTAALGMALGNSWSAEASASGYRSRTREHQSQSGALFNRFDTLNSFRELALRADGSIADLPAGPMKLAVGANIRREHFKSLFETSVNAPSPETGSRTVSAAYGELNLPLFGARNRRRGLEQLTFNAAGRVEHYQGIGSSFNPKLGMLWSPLGGVAVRTSYGTSFRAPLLSESFGLYNLYLFPASLLYLDPSQAPAGVGAALVGNNHNVRPERSRSVSVGAEITPATLPGLRASATFYAIRFTNRIALPTEQIVVIGNPALEPIVTRNPELGLVTGLFDGAGQVLDFSGPGFTNGGATAGDVVAIVDARVSNTAATKTSGLDLLLSYGFELGRSKFNLELDANRVFRFDDKLTAASPWLRTLNTPFHSLGWKARAGLSWSTGPMSAFSFVNYADGYRDNRAATVRPVHSFTTLDAGLAFEGGGLRQGALRNLRVALNVQNLLNADPPRLLPQPGFNQDIGYDPVNATGRGRAVAVQLRKSW